MVPLQNYLLFNIILSIVSLSEHMNCLQMTFLQVFVLKSSLCLHSFNYEIESLSLFTRGWDENPLWNTLQTMNMTPASVSVIFPTNRYSLDRVLMARV